MTTHIKRLETPASEFFVSQALVTRIIAPQGSYEYDIEGALQAGQYGMAFVSARNAFHSALFLHLARERKVSTMPANVHAQPFELLDADEPDGELLREAWRLETANPISPDEVCEYTERYRWFFRHVLGLDQLPAFGTLLADAEYERQMRRVTELSGACEHLGIKGINLSDLRQRVERRAIVNKNLCDGAHAGDREQCRPAPEPRTSGPPTGVDAPLAVCVSLTDADTRALAGLLREQIAMAKDSVSRTDGRDARRELATRQELCERVLAKLEAVTPH